MGRAGSGDDDADDEDEEYEVAEIRAKRTDAGHDGDDHADHPVKVAAPRCLLTRQTAETEDEENAGGQVGHRHKVAEICGHRRVTS